MEHVTLTTTDGKRLAADWYPVAQPRGWALLLHMMPATKESYADLAHALNAQRIAAFAFDQRGHGGSAGGPGGYLELTDEEQGRKRLDVDAALAFLREQGMEDGRLAIVGASIGANLALDTLARIAAIPVAVLLSPGLDYFGIATESLARALTATQRVFLAAGGTNDAYSTETVHRLAEVLGDRATVATFREASHGTEMFNREPKLLADVVRWMVQ